MAIEYECRENSGGRKLLRPVDCASCGRPPAPEPAYAVRRCGPGFSYYCVECTNEGVRPMSDQSVKNCDHCDGRVDRPGLHGCAVGGHPDPDLAQRIVAAIERDMDDRRGMGLGSFDEDIRVEIRDRWAEIVRKELFP
jgi:hypothetical protein